MGGVLLSGQPIAPDTGSFDAVVDQNLFDEVTNASGGVGQLTLAMANGTWQVLVEDNTFDTPGNAPWFVRADSTLGARVLFRNNTGIKGAFCSPDPAADGGGAAVPLELLHPRRRLRALSGDPAPPPRLGRGEPARRRLLQPGAALEPARAPPPTCAADIRARGNAAAWPAPVADPADP